MTDQIHSALVAAAGKIRGVAPDGVNSHHRYRYATAEAITLAARNALLEEGVYTRRQVVQIDHREGVPWAQIRMSATHADGSGIVDDCWWPVVEGKGRPLDKSMAVALTSAWKFWLTGLLAIPRIAQGEDMDDEASGAQTGQTKQEAPPAAHPRSKKPTHQAETATEKTESDE